VGGSKLNVRRSVERLLIPALLARGFEQLPDPDKDVLHPFGQFRRQAGDGAFEWVEVQFDKYRSSNFQIHFAVTREPEAWLGRVVPRFRLVRRRWTTYGWFGVQKKAREGISEAEYDAAVEEAVRLLPEIERVFAGGRPGWHVVQNPGSARGYFAHLGLVLVVFATPFLVLAWLLGWLSRNL
jgi:hypothetical protein